ncbi:spore coat protein [Paenibacillus athensensis]|uniref:spore coat protein n=1 Tax=Paenibacillus athensensis TaxID=1967502 RepID=UPI00142F575B|nr:spore coat protein [Paenibacillus athensensis]MCD1260773.1 spore coat protein [Paenibacillus athensensis]
MYQQNPYAGQSFGTQQSQQGQGQQVYLQEQDLGNFILSELKRTAREYATATLEAANPQIRQLFQSLLQQTLNAQAQVFQELQKLNGYNDIQPAQQQQLQQEVQKQSQTAAQLQSFVQMNLSKINTSGMLQTQSFQQQGQGQIPLQTQSFIPATAGVQQTFQPQQQQLGGSAYGSVLYGQNQQQQQQPLHSQAGSYGTSASAQQFQPSLDQTYNTTTSFGSDFGVGSSTSGKTGSGYYAGSANETATTGKAQSFNQRQTGSQSTTSGDVSSYSASGTKSQDGSKYSF